MPRADEVELVLPASRVLFARLRLPRVNAATIRELLPFAVEDRLLADPSHIHAVAGATQRARRDAGGGGRSRLARRRRAHARRAGLAAATRLVRERAARRRPGRLARGARRPDHGFLVDDDGVAVAFDRPAGGDLPLALRVAIDEAGQRGARPASVRVHTDGGAALPDLARWSEQAGMSVQRRAPSAARWPPAPAPRDAIDLLRGLAPGARFAAPRASCRAPPWRSRCAIAVLQLAFTAVDTWRLQRAHDALAASEEAVFRAAFPDAKVVVDPGAADGAQPRGAQAQPRPRGRATISSCRPRAPRATSPPARRSRSSYANGKLDVRRGEAVAEAKR